MEEFSTHQFHIKPLLSIGTMAQSEIKQKDHPLGQQVSRLRKCIPRLAKRAHAFLF